MDETKKILMEEDIMKNSQDSDDDRIDFVDAEIEEIEDKIAQKFR